LKPTPAYEKEAFQILETRLGKGGSGIVYKGM
jgi:hypothetical protein